MTRKPSGAASNPAATTNICSHPASEEEATVEIDSNRPTVVAIEAALELKFTKS